MRFKCVFQSFHALLSQCYSFFKFIGNVKLSSIITLVPFAICMCKFKLIKNGSTFSCGGRRLSCQKFQLSGYCCSQNRINDGILNLFTKKFVLRSETHNEINSNVSSMSLNACTALSAVVQEFFDQLLIPIFSFVIACTLQTHVPHSIIHCTAKLAAFRQVMFKVAHNSSRKRRELF